MCTLRCCLFFVAVVLAPHQQTLDKPLEKWTNQELIDWAEEVCPRVVDILMREQYDGLTLALWSKDKFAKYLSGGYGAAFYEYLRRAYPPPHFECTVSLIRITDHGKITGTTPFS